MQDLKKSNLHWHPAFIEAITAELSPYLGKIEILSEVPLTAEPLRIDCIIIKKAKDVVINKNFARIFRDWNIMEYKGPQDHVSVNDFQKVYGYACLYSANQNIPVTNITISFVESRHPRKLIDFLRKVRKCTVEETSPGIYTVDGDAFGIQVIDSRYLSEKENLWLRNLRGNLKPETMGKVTTEINKLGKTINLEAYWDVVSRANSRLFKEEVEMGYPTMKQLIMETEVGAGWIAEWKSQAEAEGLAKGMAKGMEKGMAEKDEALATVARNLKASGMSCDLVTKYTGLPLAKVKKL
jgi:hypothetical protein